MILKELIIRNLGAITFFSHSFSDSLNIITERNLKELSYAIRSVFNHKIPPQTSHGVGVETKIEAQVALDNRIYNVLALPRENGTSLGLRCLGEGGRDATEEYLYLTSHCPEMDLSEIFAGDEDKVFLRFLKYASEDLYYSAGELSALTHGLSDVKAFRTYLRSFIDSFEPELLRDGRQYEIFLEKNGKYSVRCKIDSSIPRALSASEKTLFRYLCFLRTAEFWHGFEKLRNLHSIKKPLIISDFLERLDESVDVRPLLERTEKLNRQILLLTRR